MAEAPVVAILNRGFPGANGVGELFLNAMVQRSFANVVRVALTPHVDQSTAADWNGRPALLLPAKLRPRPGLASLDLARFERTIASKGLPKATNFLKSHDVDLLWIVVNHPTVVPFAHRLVAETGLRFVTACWDEVAYDCRHVRLNPATQRRIGADGERLIKGSSAFGAISEQMHSKYLDDNRNIPWRVMRYVPSRDLHREPRSDLGADGNSIRIILAGSLYAVREWNALVEAVGTERDRGRSINITHMGARARGARTPPWVSCSGGGPADAAANAVNASDVGYVPYWRSGWNNEYTQTAFPTKLASYVTAGVPVLFHGPSQCAAAGVVRDLGVGVVCDSNRSEDLVAAINEVTSPSFVAHFRAARQSALSGPMDPDKLGRDFDELVDLVVSIDRS